MSAAERQHAWLLLCGSGLSVGLLVSTALVWQRVSRGDSASAFLVLSVFLGVTAELALATRGLIPRFGVARALCVQLAAACLAIASVHGVLAALRIHAGDSGPLVALRESPRQYVNDLVFAGSLLAAIWSFSLTERLRRLGAAASGIVLVGLYALTAGTWHVDTTEFARLTTQDFVGLQVVGIATGLAWLQWTQREDGAWKR